MSASLEIEFLGTGTSTGVPVIGCPCNVCRSGNPKNDRLRSSIVVRCGGTVVLVDSSPDLRRQALRSGLTAIDAVIYTHIHLDHVAGFDDLRAFGWKSDARLPLYAGPSTMAGLETMYAWAFDAQNTYRGYIRPEPKVISGPFVVGNLSITPVPVDHGTVEALGYVFRSPSGESAGYIPDVKSVPESSRPLLEGLDILIVDALKRGEHPTHSSVEESLALFEQVTPRCGYLTHMSHHIDYETERRLLPAHVFLACDGLKITPSSCCS